MARSTNRGHIFGALGIAFILIAFGIWKCSTSGPRPPSELEIQALDQKAELLVSSHAITVPKGAWYDTGIWVAPWRLVNVYNAEREPVQPFELRIGDVTNKAVLNKKNRFFGWLYTADDHERPGRYVSYIANQAKIYLKVSDEATVDKLKLVVYVWIPTEENKKQVIATKGKEEEAGVFMTILGLLGIMIVSGIATGILFVVWMVLSEDVWPWLKEKFSD
jgi:hypothetical protein